MLAVPAVPGLLRARLRQLLQLRALQEEGAEKLHRFCHNIPTMFTLPMLTMLT